MEETNTKLNFKIGADPEFAFTMQGRKIDARQTLQYILRGKPEFKELPDNGRDRTGGFSVENFGNVGWDNHTATAEIRPTPGKTPQEVVNNLAGIFKELCKHVNLFDMSTISEFGPIGGHIHLEIPKTIKNTFTSDKQNAIHRKVASFYLPVLLSENKTNLNLRIRQGYGSLKDCRVEERFKYPDGSAGYTYEFRCPSAEWLTTPKIAKATLALLTVIYNQVINHPKTFTKFTDIVYKSDKQGNALQTLAIMDYNILTYQILQKTKKYLKEFELYEEYKADIEYILNPKKVIADKIKVGYNIAIGWGFSEKKNPNKKEILSSKTKMKELISKGDFDQIKKIMNIHYNDDTNVAIFAENLKDRVATFNWKLKNNYFIFGMRKGIEEMICKNLQDEYFSGRKLIKTVLDKKECDKLFRKMTDKFFDSGSINDHTIIDFKTGKPKNTSESSIIIGLPYSMRTKENVIPFLELIWNLENEKITPEIFKKQTEELLDDTIEKIPINERGEIYRILTKQSTDNLSNNIVFANEDINQHQRIVQDMATESITNDRIENTEITTELEIIEPTNLTETFTNRIVRAENSFIPRFIPDNELDDINDSDQNPL